MEPLWDAMESLSLNTSISSSLTAFASTVLALGAGFIVWKCAAKSNKASQPHPPLQKTPDVGAQTPPRKAPEEEKTDVSNLSVADQVAGTNIDIATTASLNQESNAASAPNLPVLDVWAERRQRGILPASMDRKAGAGTDKPFASSYYFAHNNPNTTGGYKDGLSMEDYTMNGPRLLSKGGKPVVALSTSASAVPTATSATAAAMETDNASSSMVQDNATADSSPEPPSRPRRRSLPITQYMWDDEGGSTGTIIIDKLPGGLKSSDSPIPWSQGPIDGIDASLYNDNRGLRVVITTSPSSLDWDYHLDIAPLFATAANVEIVRKAKRLRIKIVKKSTSLWMSTYEKWPHAHKKKT